ncbi:MAG: hypothetical protein OJF47_000002 [Nitrospira sp.]|jgi:hypothetical protein|nr:MAG: hypothetical protein OJF47_000002 [Nitrospira sp.]
MPGEINDTVSSRPSTTEMFPRVDYTTHPAYASLTQERTLDEQRIEQGVAAIDDALQHLLTSVDRTVDQSDARFNDTVGRRIDELQAYVLGAPEIAGTLADSAARAIVMARHALMAEWKFRIRCHREAYRPSLSAVHDRNLDALRTDGVVRLDSWSTLAPSLWNDTWWERDLLKRQATNLSWGRCAMALDQGSSASRSIQNALRSSGVLDLAGAYLGARMEFLYAALDYAHDRQAWYRGCYRDIGLDDSETTYMHLDADCDIVKAMLYLTDVKPENGAFRFVRGSHRWTRSPFIIALYKGFDAEHDVYFRRASNGLDYEGGYYRPRFQVADHRRDLMRLPGLFRGSTHFGDDVIDGSPLSARLLQNEEMYTGNKGTFVLFHGAAGIHRGALVSRGERWAIQIALRASGEVRSRPRPYVQRKLAEFRYQLRRLKHCLRCAPNTN